MDDSPTADPTAPVLGSGPARVELPGSHRPRVAGLADPQPVPPATTVEVTLVLRRRAPLPEGLVTGRATIDPAALGAAHGADPADVATVVAALTAAGVGVVRVDAPSRRLVAAGPVAAVATLFGAELVQAREGAEAGVRRYREGSLSVPAALAGVVTAVLGLDERPQAQSRHRVAARIAVSYTPPELARVYRFPPGTDGSGQSVAIVELGGGFATSDLSTYFTGLGQPTPVVTAVGVDGAVNTPGGDPNGADGEVLLDVEVVGGVAPAAAISVWFAPNTDRGFLDAVSDAVHASPTPAALSISWGGPEDSWTAQSRTALDDAFADAAALGVTVTAAAGDNGSSDGVPGGGVHADFPASSPRVLACGGTSLHADPTTGTVRREVVWSGHGATGGGVSAVFARPAWQATAGVPPAPTGSSGGGRGVPDVAADADPQTGYQVLVDGQPAVIGGTSAVAPLWAGLVARLVQGGGARLGLLAPLLYAGIEPGSVRPGFRDITSGSNGAYRAGPGWDACTGLGVPDGAALLSRLSQPPPAVPSPAGAPAPAATPASPTTPTPPGASPASPAASATGGVPTP